MEHQHSKTLSNEKNLRESETKPVVVERLKKDLPAPEGDVRPPALSSVRGVVFSLLITAALIVLALGESCITILINDNQNDKILPKPQNKTQLGTINRRQRNKSIPLKNYPRGILYNTGTTKKTCIR